MLSIPSVTMKDGIFQRVEIQPLRKPQTAPRLVLGFARCQYRRRQLPAPSLAHLAVARAATRPSRWAKTPPADASIAFSLPPQRYIVLNTW
jgi:hypothetical protein